MCDTYRKNCYRQAWLNVTHMAYIIHPKRANFGNFLFFTVLTSHHYKLFNSIVLSGYVITLNIIYNRTLCD